MLLTNENVYVGTIIMNNRSLILSLTKFTLVFIATAAVASPLETEVRPEDLKIEGEVVEVKSDRV